MLSIALILSAAAVSVRGQVGSESPVTIVKYDAGAAWQDATTGTGSSLSVKIANRDPARTVLSVTFELKIRDAMRQIVTDTLYPHTDSQGKEIRYSLAPGYQMKRWANLDLGYVNWPSRFETALRVIRVKFTDGSEWKAEGQQ